MYDLYNLFTVYDLCDYLPYMLCMIYIACAYSIVPRFTCFCFHSTCACPIVCNLTLF